MEDYSILSEDYLIHNRKQFIEKILNIESIDKLKKINKNRKREKELSKHRKCPIDAHGMITLKIEDIVIDYCPECFGIWFDFGELERVFRKKIKKDQLLNQSYSDKEDDNIEKKCPVCISTMVKKKDFHSNIVIDVCTICGGLWLDTGEFAVLYRDYREDMSAKKLFADFIGHYIDMEM